MGLMKGSLYSLLAAKSPPLDNLTANRMLTHMLQALVCKCFSSSWIPRSHKHWSFFKYLLSNTNLWNIL